MAKKILHVITGIFLFLFIVCVVIVGFSASKLITVVFAICAALSLAIFILAFVFALLVNLGEKSQTEQFLSGLFGRKTKVSK